MEDMIMNKLGKLKEIIDQSNNIVFFIFVCYFNNP